MSIVTNTILRGWVDQNLLGNSPGVEKRFERVIYKTREATGSFKKNKDNPLQDLVLEKVVDRNTGQLYSDDSIDTVAKKCLGVALINLPRFIISMTSTLVCVSFSMVDLPLSLAREFYDTCEPDMNRPSLQMRLAARILESSCKVTAAVWEVLRLPYYALGIQIAAVKGIVETLIFWNGSKALEARVIVENIERAWNNDITLMQSPNIGDELCPEAVYIAPCFQSLKHIDRMVNGMRRYEVIEILRPRIDALEDPDCICPQSFDSCD